MYIYTKPYVAPDIYIKAAVKPWELSGAAELRRTVFCQEQQIFKDHDRDAIDDYATPLVAISTLAGMKDRVVGTVRIHQEKHRIWWGSRLAVDKDYRRRASMGSELIRLAVSTAHGLGCDVFYAHVQVQNEKFFQSLHWNTLSHQTIHGHEHAFMQADLDFYPPFFSPQIGWHIDRTVKAA